MEHPAVNNLKEAIKSSNKEDVTRLCQEVHTLRLTYEQIEPLIIEALKTENYDIMDTVIIGPSRDMFFHYERSKLEWTYRQLDLKDRPVAAKFIAGFTLFLFRRDITADEFINELLSFKRVEHRRNNHRTRWLVYILHQSNILSYDDLIKQPRLLSALIRWPQTELKDILNTRVNAGGVDRTLLYCVLIKHYDFPKSEKWKFIRTLEHAYSLMDQPSDLPYGILNPDLTELAACIITHEKEIFNYFISQPYCPPLDKSIDHVPLDTSPARRNLSHYFADYWGPVDFFRFVSMHKCSDEVIDKMLTTSDSNGTYSVNNLLRSSKPSKFSGSDFGQLLKAVEVIVRRDRNEIEKFTFIRRTRLYWLENAIAWYLYHLGFKYPRLLDSVTGFHYRTESVQPRPEFAATEIPIEFPFSELPIDLVALIASHVSMIDMFAVFCVSKKCFSMKKQLGSSSYWSSYFKSRGPFKHAQYLSVPKEMREDYVHYQNSFEHKLQRGLVQNTGEPYVTHQLNDATILTFDDNWVLWTDNWNYITRKCHLMSTWSKEFDSQTFQIKQGEGSKIGHFTVINSTPTDISFGHMEYQKEYLDTGGFAECTWHTYQNRQRTNSIKFKSVTLDWRRPSLYYNGTFYIQKDQYDFNGEVPITTTIPDVHDVLDVNRLTGSSIYSSTTWHTLTLLDKSNQVIGLESHHGYGYVGKAKFIDEHQFVGVWDKGILFFDIRKLSAPSSSWNQDLYVPNTVSGFTAFNSTNQYAVLTDKNGVRTVCDLHSRKIAGSFYLPYATKILGVMNRCLVTMPSSLLII